MQSALCGLRVGGTLQNVAMHMQWAFWKRFWSQGCVGITFTQAVAGKGSFHSCLECMLFLQISCIDKLVIGGPIHHLLLTRVEHIPADQLQDAWMSVTFLPPMDQWENEVHEMPACRSHEIDSGCLRHSGFFLASRARACDSCWSGVY